MSGFTVTAYYPESLAAPLLTPSLNEFLVDINTIHINEELILMGFLTSLQLTVNSTHFEYDLNSCEEFYFPHLWKEGLVIPVLRRFYPNCELSSYRTPFIIYCFKAFEKYINDGLTAQVPQGSILILCFIRDFTSIFTYPCFFMHMILNYFPLFHLC